MEDLAFYMDNIAQITIISYNSAMKNRAKFAFSKEVQHIFSYFTRLFGIRIVFFSYDGQELSAGDNLPRCKYCTLLREKLGFEKICHKLDRQQQQLAASTRKLVAYKCHGGMNEAVLPVYNSGNLIGFVMIGQFRLSDKLDQTIKKKWQRKFGTDEIQQAFTQAPVYTSDSVDNILGLFTILVEFIVSHRLIDIKRHGPVQQIIEYLEEHPQETLSISDAADLIFKSPSTFSHLFKEVTGQSFRQYQIQKKIEQAEKLFRNKPHITIKEAAYLLGYDDALYFSKLYKRHRGISPRQYLIAKSASSSI